MNHMTILQSGDYIRWNQDQGRTDYARKAHLDHLRHWWRRMVDAFPDHIVPLGQMPHPARFGQASDAVPGMAGVTVEELLGFAEAINRLSRQYALPEPFALHEHYE